MICSRAVTKLLQSLKPQKSKQYRHGFTRLNAHVVRCCSTGASIHQLKSRGLIKLCGRDTKEFLQGLVTSDVTQLGADSSAQYSMMLNVQGRVLYDLMLYQAPPGEPDDCVMMECDRSIVEDMIKIMRRYKIRKKVDISISDEWQVMSAVKKGEGSTIEVTGSVPDPRVPQFGWRILVKEGQTDPTLDKLDTQDESNYHRLRYEWGIPEGVMDLPVGNCLPLESNLVLHNGVSFQKGCYIGQELTARTHHTGVTRKRLMPLCFDRDVSGEIEPGTNISREDGKNVGKFRNAVGNNGLGLLRMMDLKGKLTVIDNKGESLNVTTVIPTWWPKELVY